MRMRRKTNLEQRLEKCAHLLVSQPDALRGEWCQTFGYGHLCLEIGCGKGRFIAQLAQNSPGVLFVALEKTANVIVTALELAARENLQNVRYVNAPAERLAEFFSPGEVSRIYINFCDPWPANRHIKRRLVGGGFLRLYREILSHDGEIAFKTDNLPLFEFSLQEFEACGFTIADSSKNLHEHGPVGIMTEYEQKFYDQGLPIYRCRAVR